MSNPNEYVSKLKMDYETLRRSYSAERGVTALYKKKVDELTDALSNICTEFNQLKEITHPNSESEEISFQEIRDKVSEYITANKQLNSAKVALENDKILLSADKESANTRSNEREELLRCLLGLPVGTKYDQIKAAAESWPKKNETIVTIDEEKILPLEERVAISVDKPPISEEPDKCVEPIIGKVYVTPEEAVKFSIGGGLKVVKSEPSVIPITESTGVIIDDAETVVLPDKDLESDDSKVPIVDAILLEENIFAGVNARCTSPELSELPEIGVHDRSALISPRKNRRVLYARVAMSMGCLSLLAYHYVKEYNPRSIASVGNGESAISSLLKTEGEPKENIATTHSKVIMYSTPPQITEFICPVEYDNKNPAQNQCQITASSSAGEGIACEINCNGNRDNLTLLEKWSNISSAFNIPAGCAPEGSTAITLEAVCYEPSNKDNKSAPATSELKIKQEEPKAAEEAPSPPQNQPPVTKLSCNGEAKRERINLFTCSFEVKDDSTDELPCVFTCKDNKSEKTSSKKYTIGSYELKLRDICSSPKTWYNSGDMTIGAFCEDIQKLKSGLSYSTIKVKIEEKKNANAGAEYKYVTPEAVPAAPTSPEKNAENPAEEQQIKKINACSNPIVKPEFKETMPSEWLSYKCEYKKISNSERDRRKCIIAPYYKGDDSLYTNDQNVEVVGCLCCLPK